MGVSFQDLRGFMDGTMARLPVSGIDCVIWQDHREIFRHQAARTAT